MLQSVAIICIGLGFIAWFIRIVNSAAEHKGEKISFGNRVEFIIAIMFLLTFIPHTAIWVVSDTSNNVLETEFMNIHGAYSDNMMFDDSTSSYLLWVPLYSEDNQFMVSTTKVLKDRLNIYNQAIGKKAKQQKNKMWGNAIILTPTTIKLIPDPNVVSWIED